MSKKTVIEDNTLMLDQRLTKQRSRRIGLNQSDLVDNLIFAENYLRKATLRGVVGPSDAKQRLGVMNAFSLVSTGSEFSRKRQNKLADMQIGTALSTTCRLVAKSSSVAAHRKG